MKPDRDIERLLDRWFADGPMEVPDRVIDAVTDRIGRQPQRPAWRLLWRDTPVNSTQRMVAATAAVILVAVVALAIVGRPPDAGIGGPPTASPTPVSPSTSTPKVCQPSDPPCTGPLAAGVHSTANLITPFTFGVPEGWSKPLDVAGSFNLQPIPADGLIAVIPDWAIASQESCTGEPEPGLGRGVDDLVTWLTEHPGLITSQPESVRVGGLAGRVLDVRKEPSWTGSCIGRVDLFTHVGTIDDGGRWDINDAARYRLFFLDTGDGHVVTIHVETAFDAGFDAFVAAATPILDSFVFE